MKGPVEIVIDADEGLILGTGESWRGLRVRYRQQGVRRWSKFIVVGQPGQSLRDLLSAAMIAVYCSEGGRVDPVRSQIAAEIGEQLDLGATG